MIRLRFFNVLFLFCTCLQYSVQDLLLPFGLDEELTPDEVELIKNYRLHRYSRQTNEDTYDASGIKQSSECGINKHSSRRKREGEPQGNYDWPWMVAILQVSDYAQFCGGALINRQYVLTAAHCFATPGSERTKDDIIVRLGEWDLITSEETKYKDVYASEIRVHEDYDSGTNHDDIALIKLDRSIDYTQYIRPICLPSLEAPVNESAIVAGWGRVESGGDSSNILLDVQLPIQTVDFCKENLPQGSNVAPEKNLCAGGDFGKDSCQGDSGGPLVYQEDGKRWVTIGIVSWGQGCGEYPGVYTNVKNYLSWMGKRILDASP